jgi:amino acid adenylation domain-containing protein
MSAIRPLDEAERRGPLPVSSGQQRLWTLQQLGMGSAYTIVGALDLEGALDAEALRRALAAIVRRHEALRTNIVVTDGRPGQVIREPQPVELPTIDLHRLDAAERASAIDDLSRRAALEPFDLAEDHLFEPSLIRLSDTHHVLVVRTHHIVGDGWSLDVLFRELSALYSAYVRGLDSSLPELPIQYADFAAWQRRRAAAGAFAADLAFWRERLADAPALLELPADRSRGAPRTTAGASVRFSLTARESASLHALAREEGSTLFMLLLASFSVLLHRYSGQSDLVVGTPIAGRTRTELEQLVGFFVNTLPLRVALSRTTPFRTLLREVREIALQAYDHQEAPFEEIVRVAAATRHLGHAPLVQVMFALQNATRSGPQLPGLRVTPRRLPRVTATHDLSLILETEGGRLAGAFEFSADLFEHETVERVARHLGNLLRDVLARPDARAGEIELLTRRERSWLVHDRNRTARPFPSDRTIDELVEEEAARAPEQIALSWRDEQLTYAELDARATALAAALARAGIGAGALVGLFVERSADAVVAMLGILKSGAAYVPLDVEWPGARLRAIVEHSRLRAIVTQRALRSRVPSAAVPAVCVDEVGDTEAAGRRPQAAKGSSSRTACVVYTSGTTGAPKGIVIDHRAVVALVRAADYVDFGRLDAVFQVSTLSFDAATFEIWGALLNGLRCIVLPPHDVLDPERLGKLVAATPRSALFLTTSLFNRLVAARTFDAAAPEYLLFGGERVDPRAVRRALASPALRSLVHVYGPTEATTFATAYPVTGLADDATTVPIGRPIANTEVYVLDRDREPVPIGVVGELYIGGPRLARGYLGLPELTAEHFVTDPYRRDGSRMYRTGDLARVLPSGAIEFVGRADEQVKLRGFRIEPGEIEAALRAHALVREAAVTVHAAASASATLVAHVVLDRPGPSPDDLREFLRTRLPPFMIPSAIVLLASLPATASGKIDRRALPTPEQPRGGETPETAKERLLAEIWQQALAVPRVGADDNFFALGGDSLLVVAVVTLARERGLELSPQQVLECPTLRDLAALARSSPSHSLPDGAPPPALRRVPRRPLPEPAGTAGGTRAPGGERPA